MDDIENLPLDPDDNTAAGGEQTGVTQEHIVEHLVAMGQDPNHANAEMKIRDIEGKDHWVRLKEIKAWVEDGDNKVKIAVGTVAIISVASGAILWAKHHTRFGRPQD